MERGKKAPAAILFDVDGTLIDSFRLYLESYRRALAPRLGYAPDDAEIIERYTARPSAERRFLADWVGAERAGECHAEMRRQYEELHAALCEGMYDGVREMLAGLRSAGLPIGVATGKGRAAWEITAAAFDLGWMEVVVTEDEVDQPKPHPQGLLAAAKALQIDPGEIVYVGDSLGDAEAGRLAGMMVGVTLWPKTGPGEREAFLQAVAPYSPDWVFERPADVVRVFAAWC